MVLLASCLLWSLAGYLQSLIRSASCYKTSNHIQEGNRILYTDKKLLLTFLIALHKSKLTLVT